MSAVDCEEVCAPEHCRWLRFTLSADDRQYSRLRRVLFASADVVNDCCSAQREKEKQNHQYQFKSILLSVAALDFSFV